MSENFEQQINHIEADNVESHEQLLEEEIAKLQIIYAKHLFENNNSNETFSEILYKIQPRVLDRLKDMFYIQNKNLDKKTYKIEENKFLKKCSQEIDEIYVDTQNNNLNITDTIIDYVKKIIEETRAQFPDSEERKHEPENKIDLLKYVPTEEFRLNHEIREQMNQEGFLSTDSFLIIHLDAAYKNESGVKDARKWLEKLSVIIIDKYSNIKGIIGISWLFDHPAIQRILGFKNLQDTGEINWNQFIDINGQIKKDLVEKSFKNNKPPFKNIVAYDTVENFLQKFLPQEHRGKEIILKDINPEWEKCYSEEKVNEDAKKFKEEFGNIREKTKENIENIFNKLPKFKELWEKLNFYDKLVEIFASTGNMDLKTLYNNNLDFFKQTEESIKNYFSKIILPEKYIDKKLIIN